MILLYRLLGGINIKVCFALLTNNEIQNYARKISVDINEKYKIGITASLLPFHISLKSSFETDTLFDIEKYFDSVTEGLKPFDISYAHIELIKMNNTGIIWFNVEETKELRELHNKLNKVYYKNLISKRRFLMVMDNHFHSTVTYGGKSYEEYKEIYNSISNKELNLK